MSSFLIAKTLWKGRLLHIALLMATFFVMGYTGVHSAAIVYDQLYPAYIFGQAEPHRGTFLYFMPRLGIGNDPQKWPDYYRQQGILLETKDEIESVYYFNSFYADAEDKRVIPDTSLMAFSQGYLHQISRLFTGRLAAQPQDEGAVPIYVSAALADAYPIGSRIPMQIGLPLPPYTRFRAEMRVAGYLPKEGLYPAPPSFTINSQPDWSHLYQITQPDDEEHIIIAFLEPLEKLAASLASEALPGHSALNSLASRVAGLRLKPGVTKEQQVALQGQLAEDGIGYGYDTAQLRASSQRAHWLTLKRYIINASINLTIAFWGTAGMFSTIVRSAKEKISILRVLGRSWNSILATLYIPAVLLGAFFCVAGAAANASTSLVIGTTLQTDTVVWLRYGMPALLFAVMALQALVTWLFKRLKDPLNT